MKPIPLVRGWALLPIVGFLQEAGAPVYRWLQAAGIPAQNLDTPHMPLPFPLVAEFLERAARASGAETLGLEVGRKVAGESFGTWGRLLVGTPTLYDRIERSIELMPLHDTGLDMWLEVEGASARLCFRYVDGVGAGIVHAEDFTLMLSLEVFQRSLGDDFRPRQVLLVRRRPQRFRRDEAFRGVSLAFGERSNAIVFPAELLSSPLPRIPVAVGHDESEELFFRHAPSRDFPGSVRDTIMALLPAGYPPVEQVARIADSSVRTLQRQLAGSGLTYSKVVDLARFALAKEYLRDPSAEITEIGLQLGYSDGTAFSRAFHRWSGMSPSSYRRELEGSSVRNDSRR